MSTTTTTETRELTTIHRNIEVTAVVYRDTQDPANQGWAYRVESVDRDIDYRESGPCDSENPWDDVYRFCRERTTISLADFCPSSIDLYSFGIRTGQTIDFGQIEDPDTGEMVDQDPFDAAQSIPFDMSDAMGTVDADGDWSWDGEGDLRDWSRNTITKLSARR
jgi:hypothetical protein